MKPQKVNISEDHAFCLKCHADISDHINIEYTGKTIHMSTFTEELYKCRHCGTKFIFRYDLFDRRGHINQGVFTGDPNDATYNWQDRLSDEQKEVVAKHLHNCQTCQDRRDAEHLQDAWFASVIHEGRKNAKSPFSRD